MRLWMTGLRLFHYNCENNSTNTERNKKIPNEPEKCEFFNSQALKIVGVKNVIRKRGIYIKYLFSTFTYSSEHLTFFF